MCKTPPTKGYTCNCNPVTVHLWEHCGNKCVWESSLCVCIYGITSHHMTSFYSLSTVELIACHMTSHIIILHCPYSCELIVCHMTSFYTVPTVVSCIVCHTQTQVFRHCCWSEVSAVYPDSTDLWSRLLEWRVYMEPHHEAAAASGLISVTLCVLLICRFQ